jgi:hypothetical protein
VGREEAGVDKLEGTFSMLLIVVVRDQVPG